MCSQPGRLSHDPHEDFVPFGSSIGSCIHRTGCEWSFSQLCRRDQGTRHRTDPCATDTPRRWRLRVRDCSWTSQCMASSHRRGPDLVRTRSPAAQAVVAAINPRPADRALILAIGSAAFAARSSRYGSGDGPASRCHRKVCGRRLDEQKSFSRGHT